ncbi:MAG: Hpt domain-containing protein [Xanthobacteraceae bacterium]|nr:Hpt domain-containing protein [Xanthobacteraceae bacterium]
MASKANKARPAAVAAAGQGPFDLAHLEQATNGDRALAREVLQLFDRQAEKLLTEIATAADPRRRSEAAHTLKGAARGVGAFVLANAAEAIETADDDPVAVIGMLARLSARVVEARLALSGLIARG